MPSVSLPGLTPTVADPVVGVAANKSAADSKLSTFSKALDKALPSKAEPEAKPASTTTAPAMEIDALSPQEQAPSTATEETVDGLTRAPAKPLDDEAQAAPVTQAERDDGSDKLAADADDDSSLLAPSQDNVAQQLTVPGLTSPSENAKPFHAADNTVGASVLASIQMSKNLESKSAQATPKITSAPKDIAAVAAQAHKNGLAKLGVDASGQPLASKEHAAAAKAEVVTPQVTPPAVQAPTSQAQDQQPAKSVDNDLKISTGSSFDVSAPATGGTAAQFSAQQSPQVTSPAPAALTATVATKEWNVGLGQQLVNLHLRGDKTMDLHLHPQDLGPISISLKVSDTSQASAQFFSHNPQVRAAIEQALPQLREAMAEQGIALGQSSVSDQRQQQAFQNQSGIEISDSRLQSDLGITEISEGKPSENQRVDGQISTYA